MKKKAQTNQEPAAALSTVPFREDAAPALPSFEATEHSTNGSLFVEFNEPGDSFTGQYLRRVEANGPEGLEYPGLLFAEYPSGDLRVVPMTWAIQEELEKQEERGRKFHRTVIQLTLDKVKTLDQGTKKERTVKLFRFGYMTLTEEQAAAFMEEITYTDQFPA